MLGPWFLALAVFAGSVACRLNRITGGRPTVIREYPSTVQVDNQDRWTGVWSQNCAGSILNTRHILSAAHCFHGWYSEPRYRRIRAGATYRNIGGVLDYVEIVYNHPTFNPDTFDGDISLIRLSDRLVYSNVIKPTILPTSDSIIPDYCPVNYVGWGAMWTGGPPSEQLRLLHVLTINNELCRERYATLPGNVLVTKNMICAGFLDSGGLSLGRTPCEGDFGGPLYLRKHEPFREFTIGVVSLSVGCGNYTFPAVNTAVAPYVDWILNTASSS